MTSRIGRFSLVGCIGVLLQLTLVHQLTKSLGLVSAVATPLSVEITMLHNFMWHERFTWRTQGPKRSRGAMLRLWRFHAGNGLVSLGGNSVLVYCLVERFRTPILPATAAAIVVCSLVNFLIADRWIFRSAID